MISRLNWFWAAATLAAAIWGMSGCTAHAPAPQVEEPGTLTAGPSVRTAPLAHDAPPDLGFVAGSDDDDVSSVAATVTRVDAGEPDAEPEVVSKGGGLTIGAVR